MPKVFIPYGSPKRPHPGLYVPPGPPPEPDPEEPPPEPSDLFWPPPTLSNPVVLVVSASQGNTQSYTLDSNTDYIIRMPTDHPIKSLNINGGRNVVVQGGWLNVPWQGDGASISARRAMILRNVTGILHIEGLLIDGDDLSEGLQIYCPDGIVQLENIRLWNMHARDQVGFTDNHPDIIQTDGNVAELRVDHFTGWTDYQGFFFSNNFGGDIHGPIHLRNVNITGHTTRRYLLWYSGKVNGPIASTLHNVWLHERPSGGGWGKTVWPDEGRPEPPAFGFDGTGEYADFTPSNVNVTGKAYNSTPFSGQGPHGADFVPVGVGGLGYVSPWGNL